MSQKEYQNVSDLITDMLTADRTQDPDGYINYENFSGAFYKGLEDRTDDFWKELLYYLRQNAPTLTSQFNDSDDHLRSVFSFINIKADLDDDDDTVWNTVTNAMRNGHLDLNVASGVDNDDHFWNESLSYIIAEFINQLGMDNSKIYLDRTHYIELSQIREADAGYDFDDNGQYVQPDKNIDGNTYKQIRGNDAIHSVLTNSSELQFTRSFNTGWMRLLMPKYLRKVEVEDLNRNFWVIAQTLSAVTAYLFNDDFIKRELEGILKELVGLWENVLYLWAAAAMISQKDTITDVQVIFTPLTNSELYDYKKFDNFGESAPSGTGTAYVDAIKSRLQYIIKQYPEANLVIIPEVRHNNYKHNYYSRVDYPGLLTYDRNTGEQIWANFVVDQAYQVQGRTYLSIDLGDDLTSNDKFWCQRIGAIKEEEVYYQYKQPFSSVGTDSPYYGAIRVVPQGFQTNYYPGSGGNSGQFQILTMSLILYDATREAIDGQKYLLGNFVAGGWGSDSGNDINLTLSNLAGTLSVGEQANVSIEHGYYLGELVSCQSVIGIPQVQFNAQMYQGQELFASTPEDITGMILGADA